MDTSTGSSSPPTGRARVRRHGAVVAALGLTAGLLSAAALPAGAAPPRPAAAAAPAGAPTPVELSRGGLTVTVAKEFPQVISYRLGRRGLDGRATALDGFTVNGESHRATTTVKAKGSRAVYTSTFEDLPGLTITSSITVTKETTVVFAVEKISGEAAPGVRTLAIPGQSLVSVDSAEPGANLARTKISTDSTTTADRFVPVTGDTAPDKGPVGTPYAFVGNAQLSAGIITNATEDSPQDDNTDWNTRLQSRIVDEGEGQRRAELSAGTYTYHPEGATDPRVDTYELPRATVVLAADANRDGTVDWQDGAIAHREHMRRPLGADRVPERVVQRIPFNFASQATNPFLKTLDNTKRISMATDDLGQWVLEKGYASEGHDSAHPDYGGNENVRAGGWKDLNRLTRTGAGYNADFAVHVNATEAYAQARTFTEDMVAGQADGWDWLNQAYHIDQRKDLGTGAVLDRFKKLRKEAPGIRTVYIDAYYSSGWLADGLAAGLREMGFEVATEWAYKFEGTSVWSHWAADKNYGGATNKGINSDIVRFIANADRDVWNVDPLLGGASVVEFEGWTGQDDWNAFYRNIWTDNLPTKFLQHFQVLDWDRGRSARLTGGVDVKSVDGERRISMDGTEILKGDTYLLPWQNAGNDDGTSSPRDADKMYFYSASGGEHTFELTAQFAGNEDFTLYELTDQGRAEKARVTAHEGRVTLTAEKGQPYVLVPNGGRAPHRDAHYGEFTGLSDPGFNGGDLDAWNARGGAEIVRAGNGDNVVRLGEDASGIAQRVRGLTPGERYTLGADVGIGPGERRETTLRVRGGKDSETRTFDITPARNRMASDEKRDTYSQRASVSFTAPRDGTVTVELGAVAGGAPVVLDDVRVMVDTTAPLPRSQDGTVVAHDDFEGNRPGWGPFVKGDAGGVTDPRTSISDLHAPYSQKEWKNTYSPYDTGALKGRAVDDVLAGRHSLKSHAENTGLVHRTTPATVPFEEGHRYRVSFSYQTNVEGQWAWVTGADRVADGTTTSRDITRDVLAPALDTAAYSREFVAGCGDTWVGLRRLGSARGTDLVLDDFTVTDLGEADTGAACAAVTAPSGAELSPGVPGEYVTAFTNHESAGAENVGIALQGLPEGWKAEVKEKDGNLFERVQPGATVRTTWLLTPPAGTAGTSATWQVTAAYAHEGATRTVSTGARAAVTDEPVLAPASTTATADSENTSSGASEGPVSNVLDGDVGTIWHTDYTTSQAPYPHWVTLKLGGAADVDGFGYLGRQSGGPNGRVADYEVAVSDDGEAWTTVATGTLKDVPQTQRVSFDRVRASYVRFTALDALNGQPYAAAAEMRVYGVPVDLPTGYPPGERPADAR
ncbi:endo-alpha-N-acetylgalactosaminidase family protein [Streptomyces sp. ME02-6987-2C]|uniref:endo-alpha-N-acetylgalactosaminidase family protein n=1 Tax=Streptomyces TaxID=1883 RepID=UPI0029BE9CE2|nr:MULTISPECIES: endo-alpha-N-acetylgalactosaminidase family protein [unclassified Streptomyces]MDX3366570.1 endo-alpha-N-acetylgalactosaminidase family protein [Streptomyces sp. ME02-6987-2C]MDX3398522.1 endo-alpha-N-acetylgalactosaminidase family protein [Streptomyces sp. ME01-18h]MDX3425540.1 endo-alpha-N-acetylgalactosaminidase family protein [Streptomyces sp. ME02-6985-2c]